jgi:putative transposase
LKNWVIRTGELHPDKQLSVWFQDEARFGQQGTTTRIWADRGTRAQAIRQCEFEWVYLFGAVCPANGKAHGCLLPYVDTEAMNAYLADFSRHLPPEEHALMVLDRAGWHQSRSLIIPHNVTLLNLPPYSPELNPAELLWWQARSKKLSNRAYESIPIMEHAVAEAWLWLIAQPDFLKSLCLFPWIQSAVSN